MILLENEAWARGRSSSIQVGVRDLPGDAEGFLLWPVDACLAREETLRALLAAFPAVLAAWYADLAADACLATAVKACPRGPPNPLFIIIGS